MASYYTKARRKAAVKEQARAATIHLERIYWAATPPMATPVANPNQKRNPDSHIDARWPVDRAPTFRSMVALSEQIHYSASSPFSSDRFRG